jgi:pyochelin biosynthetic protein PchC
VTTRPDDHDLWIRRFHPAPEGAVSLVCLPHAGGSASSYFRLSEALSPSVEVLAVQYPGRQDRRWEAPARSVAELARSVAGALEGRLDRPVAVFGHSMGAAVAFELTRLLEREQGVEPVALFASGRRAPSCVRDSEPLRTASDDEVVAEMKRLSGTDARILDDADLLRIFLPVIRADYAVAGSYRCEPGAQVRCPVTVLVGDNDPEAQLDEARSWSGHTAGEFEMHVYPGGHFYLDDYRSSVANVVSDVLLPVCVGRE